MVKWEYKTVFNDMQVTDESITNFLNAEGAEGWELVNILYLFGTFQAIFKRQVQEESFTYPEYLKKFANACTCYDKDRYTVGVDLGCDPSTCTCSECMVRGNNE